MNLIKSFAVAIVFLMLYGCQEFRGPAWSPDGQTIAYTLYTRKPAGGFETDLYIINPDAEDPPRKLGEGAACPQWSADEPMLYFLGERDPTGFYTKIMRYKPGDEKPEVALTGVHLTGMQLAPASTGPIFLLWQGRDAQPGSPARAELWNAGENKRFELRNLGELYGPAISYNGKVLVYGTKPADGHAVLMGVELSGTNEPKAIFPTADSQEPDAASFVVHAFPGSEKFLFYGPGLTGVWAMQGRPGSAKFMKFPLPEGLTCPIMARVAEDGNSASLTLMRPAVGKLTFESYKLDLVGRKWTKLDSDSSELIGAPMLDPKAKKREENRLAWLSAGGLAIGEAGKPRFLPVTAAQHLAASTQALKQNNPELALELALKAQDLKPPPDSEALSQVLYAAYLANKNFARAADVYEQSWLLEPVTAAGAQLIFPPADGLPPPPQEWLASENKKMDELIAAAPENHMIPRLREAFQARLKGEQRTALEIYQKCIDLCADRARVGGVRFQQGLCALELADPYQAGEYFEQAANIEDFPQADYAAALGAISYGLHGRQEALNKAAKLLQLPVAKKSPLAAEMGQLLNAVKGKTFKDHGVSKEEVSADGQARAWVEFDAYWMPYAATKSTALDQPDGKLAQRHFGVKRLTASGIYSNKLPTPILRVARPVTAPKLSPSGIAIAFTVSGEIFPLPDNFCELFVLDLQGKVFFGNAAAAATARNKSRHIITKFDWNGDSEIKMSGVEVDVFGGQKPFEKTQQMGRLR